jgi:hypothetical protein
VSRCDWCGKEGHVIADDACSAEDKLTAPLRQHPSVELVDALAWGKFNVILRKSAQVERALVDARAALPPGGLRTLTHATIVLYRMLELAGPRLKEMGK